MFSLIIFMAIFGPQLEGGVKRIAEEKARRLILTGITLNSNSDNSIRYYPNSDRVCIFFLHGGMLKNMHNTVSADAEPSTQFTGQGFKGLPGDFEPPAAIADRCRKNGFSEDVSCVDAPLLCSIHTCL